MKTAIIVLALACRAYGAYTFVGSAYLTTVTGMDYSTASVSTSAAGLHGVFAILATQTGGSITVKDSVSNSYTPHTFYNGSGVGVILYLCFNPITSPSMTFTVSSAIGAQFGGVMWFSGSATSTFDQEQGSAYNSASWAFSSLTAAGSGDALLLTGAVTVSTVMSSINAGFTMIAGATTGGGMALTMGYLAQSPPSAVVATWTPPSFIGGAASISSIISSGGGTPTTSQVVGNGVVGAGVAR